MVYRKIISANQPKDKYRMCGAKCRTTEVSLEAHALTKRYKWVRCVFKVAMVKELLSSLIPSFCPAGLEDHDKRKL